ncbi:hypothetical protein ASD90_17965 [Terrabacter sp. Root181]|nr:hypothetical protein ASD90_17965 [Terrabacter sp. Root181]
MALGGVGQSAVRASPRGPEGAGVDDAAVSKWIDLVLKIGTGVGGLVTAVHQIWEMFGKR